MARISDAFALIRNGANIKQGLDDSGYPITRIETISNRTVDRGKMGYAGITDISKYSDYVLQDGDILMSHINSETHLGKVAHYEKQSDETIIHGMNLLCLRPRKEMIDSRFAFYYLSSEAFLRQIPRITKKSVNQASFNVAALKELTIPIPQMDRQLAVVRSLDKVNELITLRKEQLAKLDQLVKSRFIELFGDAPDEEKVTMADICKIITDGTHQPPKFVSEGIPFLFVSNIVTNEISYDAQKFISEETYAELIKRTPIAIGDILLSTVGSYGHPAVVKTEKPFCFQRHIAYLKPNADMVDSEYLRGAILSADVQRQIDEGVKGIAQKTLNLSEIRKIKLPLPPIEQQKQFAAFVEQTDKSKLAIQQSLDKLETLKKSLMQEYFG